MVRHFALFTVWAVLGFAISLEFLYLFTPFGLAGLALIAAVIWALEGRGLNRAPGIWGLLAGPALFCILVAAGVEEPSGWLLAGTGLFLVSLAGFAFSGRARCARST